MSSQEVFLERVRRALGRPYGSTSGQESLESDAPAERASVQAQRARWQDRRRALVAQLQQQLSAVGGAVACVASMADAVTAIQRVVHDKKAQRVVRWPSEIFSALEVDAVLQASGVTVNVTALPAAPPGGAPSAAAMTETAQSLRALLAEADIGLSGVDYAIAETGTLALMATPGQMRSVSLLPPVHVAVVRAEQIVPTLADCLSLLQAPASDLQERLTSCVSFITGPSRTGDIELTLTVGVHGPGELHLIIIDEPRTD